RPEIRDVIALLRILRDPSDVVALARAFTRPPAALEPEAGLAWLRAGAEPAALESLRRWPPAAWLAELLELLVVEAQRLDVRDLFFELMEGTRYLESLRTSIDSGEASRATP